MSELRRLKPICLLVIPGLSISDVQDSDFLFFIENYPFLILKSADINVDSPWNSFLAMGTGSSIKDNAKRVSLSSLIADAGLSQLHLAESEDFSNASYFFNNLEKRKHDKEEWVNILSTKSDFYTKDSNMMTAKINSYLIKEVEKQNYDFILATYSNLYEKDDLILRKISRDFIISRLKLLISTILSFNGILFLTSNTTNQKDHNFVPLFVISKEYKNKSFRTYDHHRDISEQGASGNIYDISPTILKVLGLSKPEEMKGDSLI